MISKRIASVACVALAGFAVVTGASAQVNGFVAGGLGANTIANDITVTTPGFPDAKTTSGESNFPALQLEGGARFGSGDMIFGAGLYLNPLSSKAGKDDDGAGTRLETKVKNLWGIFGEAGWKAAPATVLYGRLSFNQIKMEAEFTAPGIGQTFTKTSSGIGFGAGVRHNVNQNMYLFVDWHHVMGNEIEFNDAALLGTTTVKFKPTITTGLIGAGWTF